MRKWHKCDLNIDWNLNQGCKWQTHASLTSVPQISWGENNPK